MNEMDKIYHATEEDIDALKMLLVRQHLPANDIASKSGHFFVIKDGSVPVAGIGMEVYDSFGLLRSLVTHPSYRNRGLARLLVENLFDYARQMGLQEMYLLTETAEAWFTARGFIKMHREETPAPIRQSAEFRHVCPASASLMKKKI